MDYIPLEDVFTQDVIMLGVIYLALVGFLALSLVFKNPKKD